MKGELSIEKEALAATWACEKFSYFILSKYIEIETDHKPLVPLLGTKHLDNLPPRVLRFRLQLDRFSYTIQHVPGKQLYTADTLSRAPVTRTTSDDSTTLQELAELCILDTIAHLPVSTQRLDTYRRAQSEDSVCTLLCKYCQEGWPNKKAIDPWSYLQEFRAQNKEFKKHQKRDYDRRHRVQDLPAIPDNTDVWVTTGGSPTPGRIITTTDTARLYIVQTPSGEIRHNRSHLNIDHRRMSNTDTQSNTAQECSPIQTRTRIGTTIAPPDRLA